MGVNVFQISSRAASPIILYPFDQEAVVQPLRVAAGFNFYPDSKLKRLTSSRISLHRRRTPIKPSSQDAWYLELLKNIRAATDAWQKADLMPLPNEFYGFIASLANNVRSDLLQTSRLGRKPDSALRNQQTGLILLGKVLNALQNPSQARSVRVLSVERPRKKLTRVFVRLVGFENQPIKLIFRASKKSPHFTIVSESHRFTMGWTKKFGYSYFTSAPSDFPNRLKAWGKRRARSSDVRAGLRWWIDGLRTNAEYLPRSRSAA
jgi:hypothetical protein